MLSPFGPLNIVTFVRLLDDGGVEQALLRMLRGWVASGQRVTLLVGSPSVQQAAVIPSEVDLVEHDGSYLGMVAALPGVVRRLRPDIVFCPGNHYSSAAAWLRARLGRDCPPIVAKVSNRLDRADQPFPVAQGYRVWLRRHPAFVDHMVAMTPAMAEETATMTGIGPGRISVIANPPRLPVATGPGAPLADGDYLIGIGRLARQKRWDRAIDAFAAVARRDARLMILGEGDARASLEQRIGALGLADRVTLPGYSNDPLAALAHARALVLTSDFEGVPGVVQEALAVGTPVVATDSSVAIRELVAHPSHGSVVATGDQPALIAAFDHWLAPGRPRPDPVPERGHDSVERYIRLFQRLAVERRLTRG